MSWATGVLQDIKAQGGKVTGEKGPMIRGQAQLLALSLLLPSPPNCDESEVQTKT